MWRPLQAAGFGYVLRVSRKDEQLIRNNKKVTGIAMLSTKAEFRARGGGLNGGTSIEQCFIHNERRGGEHVRQWFIYTPTRTSGPCDDPLATTVPPLPAPKACCSMIEVFTFTSGTMSAACGRVVRNRSSIGTSGGKPPTPCSTTSGRAPPAAALPAAPPAAS